MKLVKRGTTNNASRKFGLINLACRTTSGFIVDENIMLDKLVFLSENKTFAQNYWRDYLNTLKNLMALTVTHSSPSD